MNDGSPIPMVLCANKADLLTPESHINETTISEFASSKKFVAGYLCSSKTGQNTNEALVKLVENIIAKNKKTDTLSDDIKRNAARKLEPKKHQTEKSKGCC